MSDIVHEQEVELAGWKCSSRQSPLMATPSGSTCPEGCGRLLPRMPANVRRINHAVLLGIRRIQNKWGHLYLDDGTEVEIVKYVNREISAADLASHALYGHKLVQVKVKTNE